MHWQRLARRAPIYLAVAGVALLAARQASVAAFSTRAPTIAETLMPSDEKATMIVFNRMLLANPTAKIGDQWQAKAHRILRANPLSPGAIRILALSSREQTRRRDLMRLAERVSQRDLLTQLWLIEDAVQLNDLTGALKHYDKALSVFPLSGETLFPVLAGALSLPDIRGALAPYIRANRPWAYNFIGYATDKAASPVHVAELLSLSGGGDAVPGHKPLETQLLAKLVQTAEISTATRYAERMAGDKWSAVQSFSISDGTLDQALRPFTWSIADDARLGVTFDDRQGLEIIAPPMIRGQAANRVMVLPPGRWALTQTVTLPSLSPMADSTWSAACLNKHGASKIFTYNIPLRSGRQTYRTYFSVRERCPAVRFELIVQGGDAQEEARISIMGLSLTRTE